MGEKQGSMGDISPGDPNDLAELLATPSVLEPQAGERREAVARIICYWDQTGTCHDSYCGGSCRAKEPNAEFFKAANEILASGLVQDEAGWRDISTAPKDGTPFLAWEGSDRGPFKCWWRDEWPKREAYWMDYNDSEPNPSHWMPLPAPPIRSARDRGAEKQG